LYKGNKILSNSQEKEPADYLTESTASASNEEDNATKAAFQLIATSLEA